eukprot:764863-Hanusia_phi.AAC.3
MGRGNCTEGKLVERKSGRSVEKGARGCAQVLMGRVDETLVDVAQVGRDGVRACLLALTINKTRDDACKRLPASTRWGGESLPG